MITVDVETAKGEFADALVKLGMDQAAQVLADWIATLDENDHYRDGAEDALLTLIDAGANDPR